MPGVCSFSVGDLAYKYQVSSAVQSLQSEEHLLALVSSWVLSTVDASIHRVFSLLTRRVVPEELNAVASTSWGVDSMLPGHSRLRVVVVTTNLRVGWYSLRRPQRNAWSNSVRSCVPSLFALVGLLRHLGLE